MNYQGIDYGLGQTNIDNETGIRFGVIPSHTVGGYWYDESEAEYGKPFCPDCFDEVDETADFSVNGEPVIDCDGNDVEDEYYCLRCEKGVDGNNPDIYPESPLAFYYTQDGYKCFQGADDPDIFIEKSPYFTYAQFCSPCAPGAVYLENHMEGGVKGYCFGHDWFENGQAPYPVYSVETGELVNP